VLGDPAVVRLVERVVLLEQQELARRRLLAGVPVGRAVAARDLLGLVGLELDRVGPALARELGELQRELDLVLVVHAGLRDDVRIQRFADGE
jgi:hypothetical protein